MTNAKAQSNDGEPTAAEIKRRVKKLAKELGIPRAKLVVKSGRKSWPSGTHTTTILREMGLIPDTRLKIT